MQDGRQRIDKWLWFARFARTRTLAQKLVAAGHVRINRRKIDNPAASVIVGDVLTIATGGAVRVIRVESFAERRGGAPEARRLYEDLAPPAAPPPDAED